MENIGELNRGNFRATYVGAASIEFRNGNKYPFYHGANGSPFYVLNSKEDGWFRSDEGNSDGYGLAITEIKITSKNTVKGHEGSCTNSYKAKLSYIPNDKEDPSDAVSDFVWVHVDESISLEEVVNYIKNNNHNWRA